MDDSTQGGARGAQYTDDHGELRGMEQGVDSLGTPAAGAGADARESSSPPTDNAPRTLAGSAPPAFLYASDGGEQTAIEQGVQLTEEGEQQARGGGSDATD